MIVGGQRLAAGALLVWLATPGLALGQAVVTPSLAVSIGPEWLGATAVGGRDATLTGNGTSPLTLFATDSRLAGGAGVAGAVSVRVTPSLWGEVAAHYHSARLETRIGGDLEAAAATAVEAVQQLRLEGGGLWMPDAWRWRALRAFAAGGGGYLRQLHSSNTLAETGRSVYAGGGVVIGLPQRPGGAFASAGVRLDVRAVALANGVAFDTRLHVAPAVRASLFLRF